MKKIISFMHISLDGFVAGPNGEMNWIAINEEITDYVGQRIGRSDTSLYGRKTFEMMENYWPTAGKQANASKHDIEHSNWYSKVHKLVMSRTIEEGSFNNTELISDNLSERINQIKQRNTNGSEDILLFGSPTATHALMKENLIDGYWLFVNPIVLGQGIRLFDDTNYNAKLKLLHTHQFECGVVELDYLVER
ncbi:MAG: dihydrofolate reductase family protein [Bacteroidia bacterium]